MLFPTFTFAVFFAVVLPVAWGLRRWPVPWKLFLLGASYWFYAAWDARFVLLLVAMTLGNAAAVAINVRAAADRVRKVALAGGVALSLGVLAFFKYYDFFTDSLDRNLGVSSPALDIVLPVGVSFFTFQAISYVVDVHRGRTEEAGLLDFAVYLSFFPQLVAGPIVRATEFLPQLRSEARPDRAEVAHAVKLIGRGMFKKVVIADFLARAVVEDAFESPGEHGALDILAGIYGYAVQIYADFSGYTDMAIGVALLMGFRFPQNFDLPYKADSIQDFWRRWHMTLSRWLRDYLYIPLGGNRRGRLATYRNLLATMALGGLWHGAAGAFVLWGVYHGAGLALERWRGEAAKRRPPREVSLKGWRWGWGWHWAPSDTARLWMRRFWVFHFVCLGWVLFNSETLDRAGDVLGRLFTGWGAGPELLNPLVALAIAAALVAQFFPRAWAQKGAGVLAKAPIGVTAVAFSVWIMIVVALGPEGVADYIYFQF
ncbi:MBOAT family O-acyltransferase [Candidatus Poriferisocius sp.]|uniref:MBOAT family O-acyltransferase n=1 Tax=Candidatus Poriferisocius sp. TaxID=3101276 RepID=UPI003B01F846